MQRFSSEFSTREFDFSETKMNDSNPQTEHLRKDKDKHDKRSKSQGKESAESYDGLGILNNKYCANMLRTGQKINREWRRQRAYSDEWDRPSPPKDMDMPLSNNESNFSRATAERKSTNAIAGYFKSPSSDTESPYGNSASRTRPAQRAHNAAGLHMYRPLKRSA